MDDYFDQLYELDELLELEAVDEFRRRRVIKRRNPFEYYSEEEFEQRYRLTKVCATDLLKRVSHHLPTSLNRRGLRVSPNLQLLVTLGYLASGSYQLSMGDCTDMSQPTASKCICKVSAAIAELAPDFIKFPDSAEEGEVMQQFSSIAGMPGVIGCIDGTHVPIKSPGGDDADLFRCSNNFFSLNVMGVCDTSMRFTQLVVDWPGGYRDWDVFSGSRLFEKLESGAYQGHLLGDSNYPCRPYLLTPFPAPCSEKEWHYNTAHASTRSLMEHTFALWKKRFAVLLTPVRTKLLTTKNIITACGVLHNIAINNGLSFDEPVIGEEDPSEEPEQLEVEDGPEGLYRRADIVHRYC